MRTSEISTTWSLMLAVHASSSHALVAAKPGSAFSIDIIPASTHRSRARDAADSSKSQFGSVVANPNEGQTGYYSPVTIGNQTFQMILDTGSADLWIHANASTPQGHTIYVPSASATQLQNYTWSIKYSGGNSASGIVYTDDVHLGPVIARGQAVEAALHVPFYVEPDGILGLASGKLNQVKPEKQKTFFETVAPTLKRKLFAATFVEDGPGSWDFGFLDESKYIGDVVYTPNVQPDKYWTMSVGRYAIGSNAFEATPIGNAIVDSGSTNFDLPESIVRDYYSQVAGSKPIPGTNDAEYYFPCNSTMPDFHFEVEGRTFTLKGDVINDRVFFTGYCAGLLRTNTETGRTLFGNSFMKEFYVVFSAEEEELRIGLAARPEKK